MVVRMTKWRPWPRLSSKKFEVKITVKELQKFLADGVAEKSMVGGADCSRLAVEIKWKGSKGIALSSLRRRVKRNFTKEESLREDGTVEWNEEFQSVCNFGVVKDGVYHPWEVMFTVFNGSNVGENDKILLVSKSSLNLAGFGSTAEKDVEVSIPMEISNPKVSCNATLLLSLRLLEMRTAQDTSEVSNRPIPCLPLSPLREFSSPEKGDRSQVKAGLVNIFKGLSTRRVKKKDCLEEVGSDGKSSTKSDDAEYVYPLDTDSVDDDDTEKEEEATDGKASKSKKEVGYETIAQANHAGGLFYCSASGSEDEDWIYYDHHKMDIGISCYDNSDTLVSKSNQPSSNSPMDKLLPWRKRKVSFKSSKAKGEPLLKRHYGDEGGDDIDFDRRQLCSSDESTFGLLKSEEDATTSRSSVSEFGDDNFAVGSWEQREILSRDGHLKLKTSVFFASIDQRSERAAGEGACTSLVAVIADWFQNNQDQMPVKSQFDSLIREGSLDWRNLCENESYRERFPDKHFDLETVLQAKVRSLSVVPEKSFIGFFHPEGIEDGELSFLQGAMSFDNIWDEISQSTPDGSSASTDPLIYIVSWNDHFFILKVEQDAVYIVDTLGERLFEGCNQAFILKFDRDTAIHQVPSETQKSDDKASKDCEKVEEKDSKDVIVPEDQIVLGNKEEPMIVFQGKDTCKEYIKSFSAAIPLRELQVDLKKGLMASVPLHNRLQIEFHYTKFLQPLLVSNPMEAIICTTESLPLAA